MAEGRDHRAATKRNLKRMIVPSLILMAVDPLAVSFPLGLVMGHILTPDIDHHWKTIEELRMYRYSRLWGWAWSLFWWPYQKLHAHRGWSHTPIVGTVGRFLYLLWFPLLLCLVYLGLSGWVWVMWGYFLVAWILQDFVHLRLDYGKKPAKRRKNIPRRRGNGSSRRYARARRDHSRRTDMAHRVLP